jgi:D-alanyl-D-alanine carboxypeptidase/D-alanyl-D-alanine-endopeptidase (penicillin-binding protein 4)
LAANFNTLFLKSDDGEIVSAESQTPLTRLAVKIGHETDLSEGRFNLGPDVRLGQRYFAELLGAFLKRQGVTVADDIEWHPMVEAKGSGLRELLSYRHLNSLTLGEMVAPMMRYSTNFIANQLALKLAADAYGEPATADKVKQLLNSRLKRRFGWRDFYLEDGAGLSRENRLSARQLVDVLERFRPWKDLLPEVEPDVYAKTGTLIGVSALAGYIKNDQAWSPFALLVNQKVPFHYRNQVAQQLKQRLADEAAALLSQRPESYGSVN